MGNWVISPYLQYSTTPRVGLTRSSSEFGAAILASYSFDDNWKLAGRFEYENSTDGTYLFLYNAPNIIGFGPGSNARSITITPTYQLKLWFARLDVSYIGLGSASAGSGFGTNFNSNNQTRVMLETGFAF